MRAMSLVARRGALSVGVAAFTALALAACGGGGPKAASGTTTTAASATTTTAASATTTTAASGKKTGAAGANASQITSNWVTFFAGTTPASRKVALLQNGKEFKQIIDAQAKSAFSKAITAKVQSVNVSSATSATVDYNILEAGSVVQPNQTGQAVKSGGTWLVSDSSFCSLLSLQGTTPPACGASSGGAPKAKTTTTK